MVRTLALLVASLVSAEAAFAAPILVGLGVSGRPSAVSDDGSTVVGIASSAGFIWTAGSGVAPLGGAGYHPRDVSADGSVVVGQRGQVEAFHWTAVTGAVPFVGQDATGVSADGSVIVGTVNNEAYRWTEATGAVGLGFVFEDPFAASSFASGVSGDGRVVVGVSFLDQGGTLTVFRWTESGGMVNVIPGGGFAADVEMSGDGSFVVAHHSPHFGVSTWAASGERLDIPGFVFTQVGGINGDGSLVVGTRENFDVVPIVSLAFIWDPVNGLRLLEDVLRDEHGLDLSGWSLRGATDISADGRTLVGYGVNPSGQSEAWLVSLPEPGAAGLLGAAALAALARRLGSRRPRC